MRERALPELVLAALNTALHTRRAETVIHQGSQYTSIAFGSRCKEMGVRPSMCTVGDAYDNAMAESFLCQAGVRADRPGAERPCSPGSRVGINPRRRLCNHRLENQASTCPWDGVKINFIQSKASVVGVGGEQQSAGVESLTTAYLLHSLAELVSSKVSHAARGSAFTAYLIFSWLYTFALTGFIYGLLFWGVNRM